MIIFAFGEATNSVRCASYVTLLTALSDTGGRLQNLYPQMKDRPNQISEVNKQVEK